MEPGKAAPAAAKATKQKLTQLGAGGRTVAVDRERERKFIGAERLGAGTLLRQRREAGLEASRAARSRSTTRRRSVSSEASMARITNGTSSSAANVRSRSRDAGGRWRQ